MSNSSSGVIAGVAVVALSGGLAGGFTAYTDIQLMKLEMKMVQESLNDKQKTMEDFNQLMIKMDKTLAVNTEAINSLQKAVKRLEDGGFIAVNFIPEEIKYDSGD